MTSKYGGLFLKVILSNISIFGQTPIALTQGHHPTDGSILLHVMQIQAANQLHKKRAQAS